MKTTYRNTDTNEPIRIYERQPTGRMLPCPGDAHSNPYIDNCMICAPRWGEIPERAPVDFDVAKRDGLVVCAADVPDDMNIPAENAVNVAKYHGKRLSVLFTGYRF
jgi:hypothetical protein